MTNGGKSRKRPFERATVPRIRSVLSRVRMAGALLGEERRDITAQIDSADAANFGISGRTGASGCSFRGGAV